MLKISKHLNQERDIYMFEKDQGSPTVTPLAQVNNVNKRVGSKFRPGRKGLVSFTVLFAVIGVYFLIRSLAATPAGAPVIKVSGGNFVDGNNNIVQLHGVSRSGTEYACTQTGGFTTDPWEAGQGGSQQSNQVDYADKVGAALLTWDKAGTAPNGSHAINTVRIPMNEDCWLGINGAPAAFSGANYQAFIKKLVDKLTAQNMYVVLDLHWSAPGTWLPGTANGKTGADGGQNVAPDADHSIDFWKQVASIYKDYPNALFDLYNEPGLACPGLPGCSANGDWAADSTAAWKMYREGGTYTYKSNENGSGGTQRTGQSWKVAGLNEIVSTIRATGSTNPVIVEALGWGSGYMEMAGFNMPTDPLNQVAFSFHAYDFSGTNYGTTAGQSYAEGTLGTGPELQANGSYVNKPNILGRFPLYIGEFGGDTSTTASTWGGGPFVTNTMNYLNSKGISYTAWTWDVGPGFGQKLVNNVDTGEASSSAGAYEKPIFQSLQSGTVVTPPTTDTTAPTVSLTSPAASATVSGTAVSLAATATDNTAVSRVDFTVDGTVVNGDTSSPYSFSWNSSSIANGSHSIGATAYDAAGNKASATRTVTVSNTVAPTDTTAPTVSFTSPAANASVSGTAINLEATATDNIAVSRVDFTVDGTVVNSDTASPYLFSWNSVTTNNGAHTLGATAYDAAGNKTSSTHSVTVSNASTAPDTTPPTATIATPASASTVSGSSVTVSGTASDAGTGVKSVKVQFANGTAVTATGTTSWTATLDSTKVANDTNGSIVVTATDGVSLTGGSSIPVKIQNTVTALTTPVVTATVNSANQITMNWGAVTGAKSYLILVNGSSPNNGTYVNAPGTSFVVAGLTANTQYTLGVMAYDGTNYSSQGYLNKTTSSVATADTMAPTAPGGVSATAASATQVNVKWTSSTDAGGSGLKGYNVYRGGTKLTSTPLPTTTLSFGDTGLTANTSYSYIVEAVDGAGNATKAAAVSIKTQTAPTNQAPQWPTGSFLGFTLNRSNWFQDCNVANNCSLDVGWGPVATDDKAVTSYDIYRATGASPAAASYTLVGSVAGNVANFRDTKLSNNSQFNYRVVANDGTSSTTGPSGSRTITCNPFLVFTLCY